MNEAWNGIPTCQDGKDDRPEVCSTTIIGIGSPHGDDQFGWAVVDHLAEIKLDTLLLHKVNNPIDIIELLDESDRILLIDAAVGLPAQRTLLKLGYADDHDRRGIEAVPHRGTHDLGVDHILRLAKSLGKRTDHVSIWIATGDCFEQLGEMTDRVKQSAIECAAKIVEELCDARNVAG